MLDILAEPHPERFATIKFEGREAATVEREFTVGVALTREPLRTPVYEVYFVLDGKEFALPAGFARELGPKLAKFADAADAMNQERAHG